MKIIRVIDVETTGGEPPEHGVCELGWCDLEGGNEDLFGLGDVTSWHIAGRGHRSLLVNPGVAIPPEASAVHHLVDDDVRSSPLLDAAWRLAHAHNSEMIDVATVNDPEPVLMSAGEPAFVAYAAHSAKFERVWITDEMTCGLPWVDTYKCALRVWPDAPLFSNQGLRYWLKPAGLDRARATPAHRAGPDAYVTAYILREMLAFHPLEKLIEWSGQPALQRRCQFGRNTRGMLWTEVDDGFLYWVLERDFDEDVIFTVKHELERREKESAGNPPDEHEDDDDPVPF